MDFITENLETPVYGNYDCIVVGAGPAGCGAALSSARNGLKTILIEQSICLGGMWANGFMNPLFDSENKDGIMRELVDALKAESSWGGFWGISFHNEAMKTILERKMAESSVKILYETTFCRTIIEGKSVKGVICQNIEGRFAILGKIVIDCTGDGNVASSAGCPFEIGENGDIDSLQAMTLMYAVTGIPEKYKDGIMLGPLIDKAYESVGKISPFHMPYLIPAPGGAYGIIQFTHMYGKNPLNESDRTSAIIEGRKQMTEGTALLKKCYPEFEGLTIVTSAFALGVRESRRIIGEYMLTEEDAVEGRSFEDGICTVGFHIDIHPKEGSGQDCRPTKPYQIPMRAMIPKGYSNILVAGRCISGTHIVMASYRVTADCCAMGEACGKYAAKIIKQEVK